MRSGLYYRCEVPIRSSNPALLFLRDDRWKRPYCLLSKNSHLSKRPFGVFSVLHARHCGGPDQVLANKDDREQDVVHCQSKRRRR
jgi:hypothetical protein